MDINCMKWPFDLNFYKDESLDNFQGSIEWFNWALNQF